MLNISERYPAIIFERDREAGDQILNIEKLSAELDSEVLFQNIDLNLTKGDKVVVFSKKIQELQPLFMKSSMENKMPKLENSVGE